MSSFHWLSEVQMARLRPYFLKSHGVLRVDDRRVLPAYVRHNSSDLVVRQFVPFDHSHRLTSASEIATWAFFSNFARMKRKVPPPVLCQTAEFFGYPPRPWGHPESRCA